uniref:Uncharacterized protein n=1 Tax=Anguilla anguilla TaxID=7936 RepID=A0A0E9STK1_ANGAN
MKKHFRDFFKTKFCSRFFTV